MHVRIALFICYIIIAIPLYVLYIIELILLANRPEFSSSFYTLFMFTGVIDLIFFSLNLLFYYFPFIPGISQYYYKFQNDEWNDQWRPEYSWMLSIANTLMYYLPSIQDVTNMLVAFNRFLALLFPLLFRSLFTRTFTLALIPSTIFFSFTSCFVTIAAPGFFMDISEQDIESEKIYMLHAESRVYFPTINRSTLISAHTFACNGLCFVIYSIVAAHIFRARVTNSNEFRLFLLGFLILLTNTPAIGYQIYWSIYQSEGSSNVFMALPWVILIKTLTPPLLMIMTNAGMRREIRLLLPRPFRESITESRRINVTVSSGQMLENQER